MDSFGADSPPLGVGGKCREFRFKDWDWVPLSFIPSQCEGQLGSRDRTLPEAPSSHCGALGVALGGNSAFSCFTKDSAAAAAVLWFLPDTFSCS